MTMSVIIRFFDNGEKAAVPLSNVISVEGSSTTPEHQLAVGSFVGVRSSGSEGGDAAVAMRAVVIDCNPGPSGTKRKRRRG